MLQARYQVSFSVNTVLDLGDTLWSVTADDPRSSKQLRAKMSATHLIRAFGRQIPDVQRDLLDIALAVYVSDRVCRRQIPGSITTLDRQWRRHIEVRLPIREFSHWANPALLNALSSLLDHLTGDQLVV